MSPFHATRLVISNWKMPCFSTLFDPITNEKDKLIYMGDIIYLKGKDHVLIVQGRKNTKSKEKQNVKEKKQKSDNEDESSNPANEGSMKKGSTSKCSYCRKGFHLENNFFNNNMDIMYQILEKHNIEVPHELEKPVESS